MHKLEVILIACFVLLYITACSSSNNNYSLRSDPFSSEESSSDENLPIQLGDATQKTMEKSVGNYLMTVNNNEAIVYSGEELCVPINIKAGENNEYDITVGFSVYINGVLQRFSVNGESTEMFITKPLKADEEVTIEMRLDPMVASGDEDKQSLPVHFVAYFNPDYVPDESSPSFGNAHHSPGAPNTILRLDKKPKNVQEISVSGALEKELLTDSLMTKYDIKSKENSVFFSGLSDGEISTVYKQTDGKLSYTLCSYDNYPESDYRISFYKNNRLITFDGGKQYIEYTKDSGYLYTFSPDFDEKFETGDFLYALSVPCSYEPEKYYMTVYSAAQLVVSEDYEFITQPELPDETTQSLTSEEPSLQDSETKNTIYLGQDCSFSNYLYVDGARKQVVYNSDYLYVIDADKNDLYAKIDLKQLSHTIPFSAFKKYTTPENDSWYVGDISRINEKAAEGEEYYSVKYGGPIDIIVNTAEKCVVIDFHIVSVMQDGKETGTASLCMILNPKLELIGEIILWGTVLSDTEISICCNDFKHIYNCDINGNSELICSFDNQKDVFVQKRIGDIYAGIRPSLNGSIVGAIAYDTSGNILDEVDCEYLCDLDTYAAGNIVLFRNEDQKNIETYDGGLGGAEVLIFDGDIKKFRTIHVEHLSEGRDCGLTSDGKELLTCHEKLNGDGTNTVYIRRYDIKTGEKIGECTISRHDLLIPNAAFGDEYAMIMSVYGFERIKYR